MIDESEDETNYDNRETVIAIYKNEILPMNIDQLRTELINAWLELDEIMVRYLTSQERKNEN